MDNTNKKLKTIMILLYIAFGLTITMGCATLIGIFKNLNDYVSKLADQYFGENGALNSILDAYATSGVFDQEMINMVMSMTLKLSLYLVVFASIATITLSIILIILTTKMKSFIKEDITVLNNNHKLLGAIVTLTIINLALYPQISSIFPLDPVFILMLIALIMLCKERRKAKYEGYRNNSLNEKGVVVDVFGNSNTNDITSVFEQVPIEEYKEEIVSKEEETSKEEVNTPSNVDLESIYMGLANLEKKFKNNEISEEEYQQTKQELLSKIK